MNILREAFMTAVVSTLIIIGLAIFISVMYAVVLISGLVSL